MLDDEKINRETMIEARYKDIANLETKFTSIIEGEIAVSEEKWLFLYSLQRIRQREGVGGI